MLVLDSGEPGGRPAGDLIDEALASARQAVRKWRKLSYYYAPYWAAFVRACIIKDDMQGIYEKIAAVMP